MEQGLGLLAVTLSGYGIYMGNKHRGHDPLILMLHLVSWLRVGRVPTVPISV